MTNYYENQMRANRFIDARLREILIGKVESISLAKLIFEVTTKFPVSALGVKKRVKLYAEISENKLIFNENEGKIYENV